MTCPATKKVRPSDTKKWRRTLERLVLTAIIAGPLGWVILIPDGSPRTPSYFLWRRGLFPYREGFEEAFFKDKPDQWILGMTESQVRKRFPEITEIKKNNVHWSDFYSQFPQGARFLFLWDTYWVLTVSEGRVVDCRYLKG